MVRLHTHRPRLSPASLGLVVLAHLGGLAALASLRIVPPQIPASVLMVDVIPAHAEAPKSPQIKPLKSAPVVTPAKPQTAAPERAPQRQVETPVLATESPLASATSQVPKAQPPAQASAPPLAPEAVEPSVPRFDADYLQNPAPAYPPLSRRAGEEGKVVLKVYVEPSGLASQVEIQKSRCV